jgi:hypothetical protein
MLEIHVTCTRSISGPYTAGLFVQLAVKISSFSALYEKQRTARITVSYAVGLSFASNAWKH